MIEEEAETALPRRKEVLLAERRVGARALPGEIVDVEVAGTTKKRLLQLRLPSQLKQRPPGLRCLPVRLRQHCLVPRASVVAADVVVEV